MQSAAAVREYDDGPAKAGPGQIFIIEPIAKGSGKGMAKRHRNIGEHPLTALRKCENPKISADEHTAGQVYRTLCEKKARSGKDSLDCDIPGGGSRTPWTQEQADAMNALMKIDALLHEDNRAILRNICEEGMGATEAVMRAVACHPNGVIYRLREALKRLGEALRKLGIIPGG